MTLHSENVSPTTQETRYRWTHSLTAMRARLIDDVDAVIVLGGKTTDYVGRHAGVVEETVLAIAKAKPVFVLGGFGGAAACVGEALAGDQPERLTAAFQLQQPLSPQGGALRREFVDYYNDQLRREEDPPGFPIDYDLILQALNRVGLAGLSNGLTDDENRTLLSSPSLDLVSSLILRGLRRRFPPA